MAMHIKNKTLRSILKTIFVVPIWIWAGTSFFLFYLGDAIRWVGNWMTGFRLDDSIGTIHFR